MPTKKFTAPPMIGILGLQIGILFPGGSSMKFKAVRFGLVNGQVQASPPLTTEEVNSMSTAKTRVFLTGRIDYRDRFGKEHWTTTCKEVWATSESLRCQLYNAVDTND